MKNCTSGLYAWGGPGTIRLLQTKYHSPQIDRNSLMQIYDNDQIKQAINIFNCRDIWVSYSWGFSDETEREDREFSVSKIQSLQAKGLRVHLYVQGLNLVTSEFAIETLACVDPYGRAVPYSRGRTMVCPNNPSVITLLSDRVTQAACEPADGVYVDNVLFGFPPVFIRSDLAPFFGCACQHCQHAFHQRFSYALSFPLRSSTQIQDYLTFRRETTETLVATLSQIARSKQKLFGINLYDPVQMSDVIYFGFDTAQIEPHLDYYLIENHCVPATGRTNTHLSTFIRQSTKPVFIVSYDQGIGFEPEFSQVDYESVAGEANQLGYHPCYKVSEFTTNGIWHTLDFSHIHPLQPRAEVYTEVSHPMLKLSPSSWTDRVLALLLTIVGIPLVRAYFESSLLNRVGSIFYRRSIHAWKNYSPIS